MPDIFGDLVNSLSQGTTVRTYHSVDPAPNLGIIYPKFASDRTISPTGTYKPNPPDNIEGPSKRDLINNFIRSTSDTVQVNEFPFIFPRKDGVTLDRADGQAINKSYEYDYNSDWITDPRSDIKSSIQNKLEEIRRLHNILIGQSKTDLLNLQSQHYNRYKVPIHSLSLDRAFGHIFIVKPNCYVCGSMGEPLILPNDPQLKMNSGKLSSVGTDPEAMSIISQNPKIIHELCASYAAGRQDHFSLLLSNRALGIQINDESIAVKTYGDSWFGYKNVFGKSWEGRDPGTVTISFADDRYLTCYNIIRLWMMYIDKVYHGVWGPNDANRINKIIDYATAIYYILTGEDGTRVIFWSKMVGVFPSSANSSALAGNLKELIHQVEISTTFQYAYKIDMSPASLVEFNQLSGGITSLGLLQADTYIDPYNREFGMANPSFVGAPFITTDKDSSDNTEFNLRFRPGNVPSTMYRDNV